MVPTFLITLLYFSGVANLSAQISFDEDEDFEGEFYKQDINKDGNVNILDVVALLIMGLEDPESPVADYTDDGKCDISDVTSLMLSIMKGELSLPETFPLVGRVVKNDQGVEGVVIVCDNLGEGEGVQTATDSDGYYRFEGLVDDKYKVKPIIGNWYYTFEPEEFEVIINGDSIILPDIEATLATFTLSGRIVEDSLGLAGVTVSVKGVGVDTTVVTDSLGMFRVDSLLKAPYVVVPTMENYTFEPYSLAVTMISDSLIQDIKAIPAGTTPVELYKIGGRVYCTVGPLSDVQILLIGDMEASTVTDANGNYIFVVPNGIYTIIGVPNPTFQLFNPNSHVFRVDGQDILNLDFYGYGAGGT